MPRLYQAVPCRLQIFGPFQILDESGLGVTLPTRRTEEVLAFLALARNKQSARGPLAEDIWPGSPPDSARQSLRKALSFIKGALGEAVLTDGQLLRLNPVITTDYDQVRSAIHRARVAETSEDCALELAFIAKATAPGLLVGWKSEWILPAREEWQTTRARSLVQLADYHLQAEQFEAALALCREAARLQPHSEAAASRILNLLDQLQRLDEAEAFFAEFASRMEADLDASPSPNLVSVIRQIRTRKLGAPLAKKEGAGSILTQMVEQVYQDDPALLVSLLASEGLSWTLFARSSEALPVLARAASSVSTWDESHRKVVRDLLSLASFALDYDLMREWSEKLLAQSSPDHYDHAVSLCFKARVNIGSGDLASATTLLGEAEAEAGRLKNGYLQSVIATNLAHAFYLGADYETCQRMMLEQLGSLAASNSRRGRLALAEAYACLASTLLMQGDLEGAHQKLEECQRIASVADVGAMETGRRALYGLTLLLTGRDRSGQEIVEGLAHSIQQRNPSAILLSLMAGAGGLRVRGMDEEAAVLGASYMALCKKARTALLPASTDFLKTFVGLDSSLNDPGLIFDGSLPRIAAWLNDLLAI